MGNSNQTVLVLEDDPSSRFVLNAVLDSAGFTVLESCRATEAIEICRSHPAPIHLLLSDVVLRGDGGPEIVRELQALQPGMAILFVSGYPLEVLEHRGMLEPEDTAATRRGFLQKPFTAQSLLAAIRGLLGAGPAE